MREQVLIGKKIFIVHHVTNANDIPMQTVWTTDILIQELRTLVPVELQETC